ncbi:ubiquitin-conjugating enzyme E2 G1 isoform X3 [Leopardus geoffroyi]|uniref:ubiquitin-conjugating enzyme E2 G1 isoform X3 n=1 Tax=Herpailurus yagouaroundi TaxID=1608482 RepID=UPI001AD735AD|nr:ubiquitin-conjugating enzyme E2 G1 isoform X3 [Puma yagouaroundi]XP_043438646.1 ubiquitin-conjugating enzyme E2 G1 isoform X3 [Prionailurus bengalensis]XP_044900908.1 ubiquitin-conjugating enzyme E2 G1 isoform X4 [Felis catus]XP_045343222.1 ubiquitin-conjugating enzyme E2 G1 isoform X3 [Leopardus geoffroyi]
MTMTFTDGKSLSLVPLTHFSGVFKAHLTFPKDYPLRPPKMKFITEIWHPNVDKNGDVCISILHEPGEDKYGYEKPEERWLPIHTVETIMISVISMLADPNGDSPANVDAAGLQLRNTALFPCTLPTYRWTSVVTSWQTLAGSGLR